MAPVPAVESRRRILDAATQLMAEYGYAATSISMITRASGLPASSTYWHFGSKERLLSAVIETASGEWLRGLKRWSDLAGTPRERLAEMMRIGAAGWVAGQPAFLRLMFMIALEARPGEPAAVETVRRVRAQVRRTFLRAYTDEYGEPANAAARAFADRLALFAMTVADGVFMGTQTGGADFPEDLYQMVATAFFAVADHHHQHRHGAA